MATKVWTGGAGTTNFDDDGNWSPSGVPAKGTPGDDIHFTQAAAFSCVGTGLDQKGAADVNRFGTLLVGPEYQGDVGTAAQHLAAGFDRIRHGGRGTVYVEADDSGSFEVKIAEINVVDGTLYVKSIPGVANMDLPDVRVIGGIVILENGDFTNVLVNPRPGGTPKLVIEVAVDQLDTLIVNGGSAVSSFASHLNVDVNKNGEIEFKDAAGGTGTLTLHDSATCRYNASAGYANFDIFGKAKLDATQNANGKTITIGSTKARKFGGIIDLRNGKGNMLCGASGKIEMHHSGGGIFVDVGKTYTIGDI